MPTTPLPRRAESLAGYRAVRQVGCPHVPRIFRVSARVTRKCVQWVHAKQAVILVPSRDEGVCPRGGHCTGARLKRTHMLRRGHS